MEGLQSLALSELVTLLKHTETRGTDSYHTRRGVLTEIEERFKDAEFKS